MAEKKYLDDNGLLYLWGKIKNKLEGKVDKVDGKGLSTNDYTTDEKNKLAGLSNYTLPTASATKLGGIKVGNNLTITNGVLSADAQSITVDSALSTTSENPVQNKVINTALGNKVDKVDGKGLSTNDYTTTEKNKLSGIAASAQVNKIESIKVNGTAQTITSKAVDITVPTNNNQLTNGAGYQTATEVQALIDDSIKGITGIDIKVVTSLPTTGVKGTIYLVSNGKTVEGNTYDEYIWLSDSNKYEKIGTTEVDLSGYVKSTDLKAITNSEIDTIVAT